MILVIDNEKTYPVNRLCTGRYGEEKSRKKMKTRRGAEGGEFTSVSPSLRAKFPQKPVCRLEKDGRKLHSSCPFEKPECNP